MTIALHRRHVLLTPYGALADALAPRRPLDRL